MSEVRLRRPIHHGSVLAAGLAIDTRLVPEPIARRRILELSSVVQQVRRAEAQLITVFRDPVRMSCASALGTPLVRQGRLLSAAPLERDEQKALEAPVDAVVLVHGGIGSTLALDELAAEELASWLDLSAFVPVDNVRSLGEITPRPKPASTQPLEDVRGAFGITPLSEDAHHLIRSLVRGRVAGEDSSPAKLVKVAKGAGRLWNGLVGGLRAAWRRLFYPRRVRPPAHGLAVVQSSERPQGSWFSRLRAGWSQFVARMLLLSRFAPLLGRRHAEYLTRMLEMFDSNRLDEALRHAIPLGGELDAALRPPPLSPPSPRSTLAIAPQRTPATASLGLGEQLFDSLRQRYRRAYERLAAAGDIERAAFVLAELLNSNEEAVSFLECNGRVRLAAEIAEARELAPGLVIRLWFLAGDHSRALRIALRTGAFADAVVRLETTHPHHAHALRLRWADRLASGGAYAAAVDAVWNVPHARDLALDWLERAIQVGGVTGARMLARKAASVPSAFSEVRDRVLDSLQDPQTELTALRAFAQQLSTGDPTPEARALARPTARRLLRDSADRETQQLVQRLLDLSGDATLRADVRASRSPTPKPNSRRSQIQVRAFGCTHAGRMRGGNQDTCLLSFLDKHARALHGGGLDGNATTRGLVLGVFDGSGGWESNTVGRMASQTIVNALQAEFAANTSALAAWARGLVFAMDRVNRQLFEAAQSPAHRGTAASATVATFWDNKVLFAQLGDTRGHVLRGKDLIQVTRDHSLLNDFMSSMRDAGTPMTQQQIEEFPHQSVITRALGITEEVVTDIWQAELEPGDDVLLCSDGLWSVIDADRIRTTLIERHSPQAACDALLSMALEAGATDDISIVVARIEGKPPARAGGTLRHGPYVPPPPPAEESASVLSLSSRPEPLLIQRRSGDRGAMQVLDAAELPDGQLLVALGEAGVWLLTREGKVSTRFAEPADRLVISDHGDRAILVARRGEANRVARLDLLTRKVRYWCDARFDSSASDFDGFTWFVSQGDTVYAIDATAEDWEHQWQLDERGAAVRALRRSSQTLSIWFVAPGTSGEIWTFELPSFKLRQRQPLEHPDALVLLGAVSPGGKFAGWRAHPSKPPIAEAFIHRSWKDLPGLALPHFLPPTPYLTQEWIALPALAQSGTTVHLVDASGGRERARLQLEGTAGSVGVRIQGEHLCVFDACGRVIVLCLQTGTVLREHHVS